MGMKDWSGEKGFWRDHTWSSGRWERTAAANTSDISGDHRTERTPSDPQKHSK